MPRRSSRLRSFKKEPNADKIIKLESFIDIESETFELKVIKEEKSEFIIKEIEIDFDYNELNEVKHKKFITIKEEKIDETYDCIKTEPEVDYELELPSDNDNDDDVKVTKRRKLNSEQESASKLIKKIEPKSSSTTEIDSNNKIKTRFNIKQQNGTISPIKLEESVIISQQNSKTCVICQKTFSRPFLARKHLKVHFKTRFKCQKCESTFKHHGNLLRHNCDCTCQYCHMKLPNSNKLREHMRFTHPKELNITWKYCDKCGKKFWKMNKLNMHMRNMHINPKVQKILSYVCDYDGKVFHNKGILSQHMTGHMEMIECEICHKKIKRRTIFSHMSHTHATELKFKCEICQKAFKTKALHSLHVAGHDKKFKCEICERKFASRPVLVQHIKIHINPFAFKCEVCQRGFNRRQSLKSHRKIHQPKELYCPRCDYSCRRIQHLKHHIGSHERLDKKFEGITTAIQCSKCTTMCRNKAMLNAHLKYVHPAAKFECDLCGRLINMKANVKKHLRKFHKIQL